MDAALIGPCDLSASLGYAGQLDYPNVATAQRAIFEACRRYSMPAGIDVVQPDSEELRRRLTEAYRFLSCSIDIVFIRDGSRRMLNGADAGDSP